MRTQRATIWSAWVVAVVVVGGCSRDANLAGKNVRSVQVQSVTHYGLTLHENAAPLKVAYVALRAIREDFVAKTPEEREVALGIQFDVCAANMIGNRNRTSISRDEFVYNVVYHWTPTVSHYVDQFPTDFQDAESRLIQSTVRLMTGEGARRMECDVRLALVDPDGDPNAGVELIVWLLQDEEFWRVTHVGFDRKKRPVSSS